MRTVLGTGLALLLAAGSLRGQTPSKVERPRITGIAEVGFFTSDLPKTLAFWHDLLGYEDSVVALQDHGVEPKVVEIRINDRQQVELFNERPPRPHFMMSHVSFWVDDIGRMRRFLQAHGYEIKPAAGKNPKSADAFEIADPDGMPIQFEQRQELPEMRTGQQQATPDRRVSPAMYHAGYMVSNARKTIDFYTMLGFIETWRGGADPRVLSWVNLRVPDGTDYVELMLYGNLPPVSNWGSRNHLSLSVPDMQRSVADLERRPAFASYAKPLDVHTGVNGKHQVNLFDPDGTRVELMEPFTVDGKPRPSSSAPFPVATP